MAKKRAAPKGSGSSEVATVRASSTTRALNIVGDRWSLLIIYLAFIGVRRFDHFKGRIGIARSLLISRLRRLEAAGILERRQYQDRPPRDEYLLTSMGLDLTGFSLMLIRWEKRWYYDPKVSAHAIKHSCGATFTPELRCTHCDALVEAKHVKLVDGPGAGVDAQAPPRAQRRSIVATDELGPDGEMLELALELVGDRWTALTISAAFEGKAKFNDFKEALGAATNIIADRLARLVELDVLERRQYESSPPRSDYRLTPKGVDFYPLIAELTRWGARWLSGDEGPPEHLVHTVCGKRLKLEVSCDACGQPANRESVFPWLKAPSTKAPPKRASSKTNNQTNRRRS